MNLEINNTTCESIVYNGHYLEKLYFGNDLVWEKQHAHDYSQDYFTIESLEDSNSISVRHESGAPTLDLYYSLDNGLTWNQGSNVSNTWTLNTNDKLLMKCVADGWASIPTLSDISIHSNILFASKQANVYGNIMSLIYGDNFIGQTSFKTNTSYVFNHLFAKVNNKIVNANNLMLPATTLVEACYGFMFAECDLLVMPPNLPALNIADYCYSDMFMDCVSLSVCPQLPATNLAIACYKDMFWGCSSITTAPDLPATTLATRCYYGLFYGCSSLTETPILRATTLVDYCYNSMFWSCSSLNKVTCLATNVSADSCLSNWLYNVSSTGTFYKDSTMSSWPSGVSGIPTGWSIQNYN